MQAGADDTISTLSPTDTLIDAAGRWFLQSGIQEASGGVARYYRSDLRKNAPVSTEITGYAVSTLLFLDEERRSFDAERRSPAERRSDMVATGGGPEGERGAAAGGSASDLFSLFGRLTGAINR